MSTIPNTVCERLLKRGGAQRVSADAKTMLAQTLENYAANIAHQAVAIAQREGRTTVRAADIARAQRPNG